MKEEAEVEEVLQGRQLDSFRVVTLFLNGGGG